MTDDRDEPAPTRDDELRAVTVGGLAAREWGFVQACADAKTVVFEGIITRSSSGVGPA